MNKGSATMQFFKNLFVRYILFFAAASLASAWYEPFDPREATIDSVHQALFNGRTSCRSVVSSFIARIEAFNPAINAIITLNPQALAIADEIDANIAVRNFSGSLLCIPILLKDNYDTVGMNTTGGCLAMAESQPKQDGLATAALKAAGAIILGKANMHELALEGLTVSSVGGQTINPYDHTRTPGGSSGGTAAGVATSFAVFGTGSDTVNSLRSPASANNLFTMRPTRGLITRTGVIPLSFTQDAIGPITRSVSDLAKALTVMTSIGYDPADNTTALIPPASIGVDYSSYLYGSSLKGLRFGLLNGFFNFTATNETTPVVNVMNNMVSTLTKAGAIIVPINSTLYDANALSASLDVQSYEYREDMDSYLSSPSIGGTHPSSLTQLYLNSSGQFLVIPTQYSFIKKSLASSTNDPNYAISKLGIANLTIAVRSTFASLKLDALIYPEQKNLIVPIGSPSQSGRNGILAALTGSPVVVVPAGFSPPTASAPIGIPIGMEIMGLPWSEGKLLSIAAEVERITPFRTIPSFASGTANCSALASVPTITPNRGNISPAYPIGVL